MKKIILFVLLMLTLTHQSYAYNDWYKQGFADGMAYTEQQWQARMQQMALENQQLRAQLNKQNLSSAKSKSKNKIASLNDLMSDNADLIQDIEQFED